MALSYEQLRSSNIERNQQFLESLGILNEKSTSEVTKRKYTRTKTTEVASRKTPSRAAKSKIDFKNTKSSQCSSQSESSDDEEYEEGEESEREESEGEEEVADNTSESSSDKDYNSDKITNPVDGGGNKRSPREIADWHHHLETPTNNISTFVSPAPDHGVNDRYVQLSDLFLYAKKKGSAHAVIFPVSAVHVDDQIKSMMRGEAEKFYKITLPSFLKDLNISSYEFCTCLGLVLKAAMSPYESLACKCSNWSAAKPHSRPDALYKVGGELQEKVDSLWPILGMDGSCSAGSTGNHFSRVIALVPNHSKFRISKMCPGVSIEGKDSAEVATTTITNTAAVEAEAAVVLQPLHLFHRHWPSIEPNTLRRTPIASMPRPHSELFPDQVYATTQPDGSVEISHDMRLHPILGMLSKGGKGGLVSGGELPITLDILLHKDLRADRRLARAFPLLRALIMTVMATVYASVDVEVLSFLDQRSTDKFIDDFRINSRSVKELKAKRRRKFDDGSLLSTGPASKISAASHGISGGDVQTGISGGDVQTGISGGDVQTGISGGDVQTVADDVVGDNLDGDEHPVTIESDPLTQWLRRHTSSRYKVSGNYDMRRLHHMMRRADDALLGMSSREGYFSDLVTAYLSEIDLVPFPTTDIVVDESTDVDPRSQADDPVKTQADKVKGKKGEDGAVKKRKRNKGKDNEDVENEKGNGDDRDQQKTLHEKITGLTNVVDVVADWVPPRDYINLDGGEQVRATDVLCPRSKKRYKLAALLSASETLVRARETPEWVPNACSLKHLAQPHCENIGVSPAEAWAEQTALFKDRTHIPQEDPMDDDNPLMASHDPMLPDRRLTLYGRHLATRKWKRRLLRKEAVLSKQLSVIKKMAKIPSSKKPKLNESQRNAAQKISESVPTSMTTSQQESSEVATSVDQALGIPPLVDQPMQAAGQSEVVTVTNRPIGELISPPRRKRGRPPRNERIDRSQILRLKIDAAHEVACTRALGGKFDDTAGVALAVIMEELLRDLMLDWGRRVDAQEKKECKGKAREGEVARTAAVPGREVIDSDAEALLPLGPLRFSKRALRTEALLQVKGANLDTITAPVLTNRLEALFGKSLNKGSLQKEVNRALNEERLAQDKLMKSDEATKWKCREDALNASLTRHRASQKRWCEEITSLRKFDGQQLPPQAQQAIKFYEELYASTWNHKKAQGTNI